MKGASNRHFLQGWQPCVRKSPAQRPFLPSPPFRPSCSSVHTWASSLCFVQGWLPSLQKTPVCACTEMQRGMKPSCQQHPLFASTSAFRQGWQPCLAASQGRGVCCCESRANDAREHSRWADYGFNEVAASNAQRTKEPQVRLFFLCA